VDTDIWNSYGFASDYGFTTYVDMSMSIHSNVAVVVGAGVAGAVPDGFGSFMVRPDALMTGFEPESAQSNALGQPQMLTLPCALTGIAPENV
jgi:hypothetical protein